MPPDVVRLSDQKMNTLTPARAPYVLVPTESLAPSAERLANWANASSMSAAFRAIVMATPAEMSAANPDESNPSVLLLV